MDYVIQRLNYNREGAFLILSSLQLHYQNLFNCQSTNLFRT